MLKNFLMRKDEMYEDSFYENIVERILEHYKESQTLSRSQLIQIIKEENKRFLIDDMQDIYGELEIDAAYISHASPAT
jgi:hypothetical protein